MTAAVGLDRTAREDLLGQAQQLARQLGPQACSQAAAAQSILRAQGLDTLRQALALDLPAGGNAQQWREFRAVMTAEVAGRVTDRWGEPGLAFLLGWLKRLGKIRQAQGRSGGRPRRQGA